MKKPIFMLLLITLCSFQNISETNMVVMKAAESQLPGYLEKIPPGNERAYGFTEKDDLDACTVGKPYRMLTFNADFYLNKLEDEKNYIDIKNEWRVPVAIKDTNRVLLTVGGNPGNYIITGMGAPLLATELQQVSAGSKENDVYYILQVPALLADFFVAERDNSFSEARFIPLASAVIAIPALAKKDKPYYSVVEIEHIIKDALPPPRKK